MFWIYVKTCLSLFNHFHWNPWKQSQTHQSYRELIYESIFSTDFSVIELLEHWIFKYCLWNRNLKFILEWSRKYDSYFYNWYCKVRCQITDSIHFPLLDIWEEINCDKSTTVLESYGRTVLLISTSSTSRCISGNKSEAHLLSVNDRNGDLFGYFVPGKLPSQLSPII